MSIRLGPVSPRISIGPGGRSSTASHPARSASSMSWLTYATRSISRTILPSSVAGSGARPEWLTIPSRTGVRQVQALAVTLERVDDPQRLLVMLERGAEAFAEAAVEHVLADVAERRVPKVVTEPDRLDEVLIQRERAGDRPRDLRDLQGVGQPGPVMVAGRGDEHLGLVLEPPERLAVDDSVAVGRRNGVRSPQSGSGRARSAGYERVASGERSRSSRRRIRSSNASATGPRG